jgi:flagellar motor switch protein FliG
MRGQRLTVFIEIVHGEQSSSTLYTKRGLMSSSDHPPQLAQLIEVMRGLDTQNYEGLLAELMVRDASLAEAILEAMFSFEDLIYITDRGMQLLIKEIDRNLLTRALKRASEEVRQKVLSNLSKRAGQNLLEELSLLPPMRLSEVKEAQRSIARLARSLEDMGKIVIIRPDDHDPLV